MRTAARGSETFGLCDRDTLYTVDYYYISFLFTWVCMYAYV